MPTREEMLEKLKSLGIDSDLSLVEGSLVSNLGEDSRHKMFQDFLEMLKFFNDDTNVFKLGRLKKTVTFPVAVGYTYSAQRTIVEEAVKNDERPRYVMFRHLLKNYNIACSATENKAGNKSDQFTKISTAFVNFNSLLEYQQARVHTDEDENGPSEKLKSGVLKR